ncbi:hypothetical protein SH611_19080 [Geminicoccaceae bacterium 1502E]|nr:hypothetical protein [Geminicoccaceae bacterium 1502E]
MWLVLTFVACLADAPQPQCRHVELAWEGSSFACTMFGQREAARWIAEHDGWTIRGGWRCIAGKPV